MDIFEKLPLSLQKCIFFYLFEKCYKCKKICSANDIFSFNDFNDDTTNHICNKCLEDKIVNHCVNDCNVS